MALPQIVWVTRLLNAVWVEVQATEVEVNGSFKALFTAEATTFYFDHFDFTVGTFSVTITGIKYNCIDDAPEMLLDHLGFFHHSVKGAFRGDVQALFVH